MSSEQGRWRRREGDYPLGHALVCARWQIIAIPQPDGTWIVRQPGTRERKYANLEQLNAEIDKMEPQQNPQENPQRQENGAGLGGFLGSLGGVIVSSTVAALGAPIAVAVPVAVALSAGGGAIGARIAAEGNKKSATTWGGVGGIFGPIGAAIGGYFSDKESRQQNPSAGAVILGTTAAVATVGLAGYGIYRWRKHKQAEPGSLPPAAATNPRRGLPSHHRRPRRLSLRA